MRENIGKRLRFEVFARDGFACRYCGRKSDIVELVIDHINPVSNGGTNEIENLATSCVECNSGKGAKLLNEQPPEPDRLRLMQEMREQLRQLALAKEASEARSQLRDEVCSHFCSVAGIDYMDTTTLNVLMSFVKQHGIQAVFEWIEIADCRCRSGISGDWRKRSVALGKYISGIRRSVLEEAGNA